MKEKAKRIILFSLPYIYMVSVFLFRVHQIRSNKAFLKTEQFEFIAWLFTVAFIVAVQYLYSRNKRLTEQKTRDEAVMETARQIQTGLVPHILNENADGILVSAYMLAAKEVGGDFYDFFRVDGDHLAFVIADVSGKGVPAALFMMRAKTLIKSLTQPGEGTASILKRVNDELCEGNEAGLFVTVWLGILEISSGRMTVTNAGHEHPVVRRKDGAYELMVYKHSIMLGVFEDETFEEHEFMLKPGDSLFVYIDGVVEADNASEEMFGTDRLTEALNKNPEAAPEEAVALVKETVDAFSGDAEQFQTFADC